MHGDGLWVSDATDSTVKTIVFKNLCKYDTNWHDIHGFENFSPTNLRWIDTK